MTNLQVTRNNQGRTDSVLLNIGTNDNPRWLPLPFVAESRMFVAATEIDRSLTTIAQELPEWADLDLSDHPPEPEPTPPDYQGFEADLRGTPLFARAFSTQNSNALSVLLYALQNVNGTPEARLQDFLFALSQTIAGVDPPLTAEERSQLATILENRHFPAIV